MTRSGLEGSSSDAARPVAWHTRGLLLAAGFVVGTLLTEIGLRLLDVAFPPQVRFHPILGYAREPGVQFQYRDEGEAFVQFNSAGFRDREHSPAKRPGTRRVAILGDSFVEAWEVDLEETFWFLLEQRLNQDCRLPAATDVEVLSFGVRGYSTAQEYLLTQLALFTYAPDVVVLAAFPGNDVVQNSKTLYPRSFYPYYLLQADGGLELETAFSPWRVRFHSSSIGRIWRTLNVHSRLVQLAQRVRERFRYDDAEGFQWDGTSTIYSPPSHPDWIDAWQVTEQLILRLDDLVSGNGATLGLVVLPTAEQLELNPEKRSAVQQRFGFDDYFYPDRRLSELAAQAGIPSMSLGPLLHAYATERNMYLNGFDNTVPGFGHWNERGHAAASQYLTPFVCEQLLRGELRPSD